MWSWMRSFRLKHLVQRRLSPCVVVSETVHHLSVPGHGEWVVLLSGLGLRLRAPSTASVHSRCLFHAGYQPGCQCAGSWSSQYPRLRRWGWSGSTGYVSAWHCSRIVVPFLCTRDAPAPDPRRPAPTTAGQRRRPQIPHRNVGRQRKGQRQQYFEPRIADKEQ